MKKLFLILIGSALWMQPSNAQINVNINLGAQPQWGPSGYNYVDYYYLPDIETYYSVPQKQFIYLYNGTWRYTSTLPSRYSGYNLYNGYKVVLNTPQPYRYFNDHKVKYAKYKGVNGRQSSLRSKAYGQAKKVNYTRSRSSYHPGNNGNGNSENGNGRGNGKGKGKH